CALADDPDCSAVGGSCPSPLACVGRQCLNVCTLGPECPAGSECVPVGGSDPRARCVRTEGVDAGLVSTDASPIDAGMLDAARDDGGTGCALPSCEQPVQLSLGDAWSCVRTDAGHLWCWGDGRS